jgi:ribosomal protein S18 acetylase RimI-like enzyme
MLGGILARIRRRGFDGPFYRGVRGKLRFVAESTVARSEIVFVCTPESFAAAPRPTGPSLELHPVERYADLEPFRAALEAEYHPGYLDGWRAPFTWGERAVVGTVEGKVACYNWMQFGTRAGFPTYWGRMFQGEARVLRGGVAPSFRRSGLNTLMKHRLLERFFGEGATRVYAECYKYNLPSVRTLLKIGFYPVGLLRVVELGPARNFVKWLPIERAYAEFRALGIDLEGAVPGERTGMEDSGVSPLAGGRAAAP